MTVFEADYDADAERARRGPLNRRDLVLSLVFGLVGAVLVGITGAIVVVQLAISTSAATDLPPIVVTGAGPAICWLAGALVALIRLVRRTRAWPAPLVAIGGILLFATVGMLWWVRASGVA